MKRDKLIDAFQYIDDRYLSITEKLSENKEIPNMKRDFDDFTPEDEDFFFEPPAPKSGKLRRTLLIAACAVLIFSVTAFAISYFSMSDRTAYDGEEYRIVWDDSETGFLTWTDLKYVLKFEGAEECRGIRFKEGWLPFAPNKSMNAWACDKDGWRSYLVSEGAPEVDSGSDNFQPYRVELYYAPQFLNDGALLLMDQTPGEIVREQWGEEQVMKFTATQHRDAVDIEEYDLHIPAKDLTFHFVLRFHPGRGYVLITSGSSDMETVERIARELQVKETDEIIRSSDFQNNCTFFDVSQG